LRYNRLKLKVDESMRKKQDTKVGKNIEDLKSEILIDNLLIYEALVRKRMT
jgi:hypothetical protein